MKRPTPAVVMSFAAALVLTAGTIGLIVQANRQRSAIITETAERRLALALLERPAAFPASVEATADLTSAAAKVEARLTRSNEMDTVLEEISRVAEVNFLTIRTLRAPGDVRGGAFDAQEINLSLSGDFAGFYQFLQRLESMTPIARVRTLTMTPVNEQDGQVQVDMTLCVYLVRPRPADVIANAQ